MEDLQRHRIADIEALRAVAILLVLVHHARSDLMFWGAPWKSASFRYFNGAAGVDLFLVVSGLVIGGSLLPQLRSAASRRQFWSRSAAFWLRRFWRLIPSAWLWLLIPLVLSAVFNRSGAFGTVRGNVYGAAAAFFQVANFYFNWLFPQHLPELTNSVFVYWSLSLEEQFYLFLPVLLFFCRGKRLPLVLGLYVLMQLAIDLTVGRFGVPRSELLAAGVLLALWQGRESWRRLEPRWLDRRWIRAVFVVTTVAALSYATTRGLWGAHGYREVSRLAFAFPLVWAASYDRGYIVRSRWLNPVCQWLGSRSYSLYLVHIPAYNATRELFLRLHRHDLGHGADPRVLAAYGLTAAVLVLLLADLNFRFLETPLRLRGRAIARAYLDRR